jgi:protein-disulfide isomerase
MANKTRQQSKSERAQALMKEQQRKERMRNLLVVGAVVVAVLLIGVTMFVISSNKDTTGQAVSSSGTPKNLTGDYNVVVGKSDAPTTIKIYEDFQCPICNDLEKATGAQLAQAVADGKVKVDYHMVSFLDRASTTAYSSRALNAAMAVLSTAGPEAFVKFHSIAYANQPEEGSAGVPDSTLVDWAVQAGAKEADVKPLIDGNVYHQWTVNATDQMSKDGITGTPTVFINGKDQGVNVQVEIQNLLNAIQ